MRTTGASRKWRVAALTAAVAIALLIGRGAFESKSCQDNYVPSGLIVLAPDFGSKESPVTVHACLDDACVDETWRGHGPWINARSDDNSTRDATATVRITQGSKVLLDDSTRVHLTAQEPYGKGCGKVAQVSVTATPKGLVED